MRDGSRSSARGEDLSSVQGVYCETADDLRTAFATLRLDSESPAKVNLFREFLSEARNLLCHAKENAGGLTLLVFPKNADSKAAACHCQEKIFPFLRRCISPRIYLPF
jgi:hypothetical protein